MKDIHLIRLLIQLREDLYNNKLITGLCQLSQRSIRAPSSQDIIDYYKNGFTWCDIKLNHYLMNNRPSGTTIGLYWWGRGESTPRKEYVEKLIKDFIDKLDGDEKILALLYLLRSSISLNKKQGNGLCYELIYLHGKGVISKKSYKIIFDFINSNKPLYSSQGAYWWYPTKVQPRIDFLTKHIKRLEGTNSTFDKISHKFYKIMKKLKK